MRDSKAYHAVAVMLTPSRARDPLPYTPPLRAPSPVPCIVIRFYRPKVFAPRAVIKATGLSKVGGVGGVVKRSDDDNDYDLAETLDTLPLVLDV